LVAAVSFWYSDGCKLVGGEVRLNEIPLDPNFLSPYSFKSMITPESGWKKLGNRTQWWSLLTSFTVEVNLQFQLASYFFT